MGTFCEEVVCHGRHHGMQELNVGHTAARSLMEAIAKCIGHHRMISNDEHLGVLTDRFTSNFE